MKKLLSFCLAFVLLSMSAPAVFGANENANYPKEYGYEAALGLQYVWIPDLSTVRVAIWDGWWNHADHAAVTNAVLALYDGERGQMCDIKIVSGNNRETVQEDLHYASDKPPLLKVFGLDNSFAPVIKPYVWQTDETQGVTIKYSGTHQFPNTGFGSLSGVHELEVYQDGARIANYQLSSANENVCTLTKRGDGSTLLTVNGEGDSDLTLTVGTQQHSFLWHVGHTSESDGIKLRWTGHIIRQSQNGSGFGTTSGKPQTLYLCQDGVAIPASDYTCKVQNPNVCTVERVGDKCVLTPKAGGTSILTFTYKGNPYTFRWRDRRNVDGIALRWTEVYIRPEETFGRRGSPQSIFLCEDSTAIPASDYTCESSNTSVCTVERVGGEWIVTPKAGGSSKLTITYGGKTYDFFWHDDRTT